MLVPRDAHRELTDKENAGMLGTLTYQTWKGLVCEEVASQWYRPTTDLTYLKAQIGNGPEDLRDPSEHLVEVARYTSGSIMGEARKDLRDVLVGSPQSQTSLSVGVANLPPKSDAVEAQPAKKKGW